jgi:hypothetical protein
VAPMPACATPSTCSHQPGERRSTSSNVPLQQGRAGRWGGAVTTRTSRDPQRLDLSAHDISTPLRRHGSVVPRRDRTPGTAAATSVQHSSCLAGRPAGRIHLPGRPGTAGRLVARVWLGALGRGDPECRVRYKACPFELQEGSDGHVRDPASAASGGRSGR